MTPSFPTLRSSDLTSPRVRPVSTGKDGVVRLSARASVGNRPEDAIAPEMKPRRFSMAAPVRQGQRLPPSRTPWEGLPHADCRPATLRPAFRAEAHRPSRPPDRTGLVQGKRMDVRVLLGGRRQLKKKTE